MNTAEQEIRTLRKKARSWLASLTYYSALGKVNLDTFSKRLQSLVRPVLKPDILQEVIKGATQGTMETKDAKDVKKRIMSRLTPGKIHKRMLGYPQMHSSKALKKEKPGSFTLGRLLIAWAILTNQTPEDFIVKIFTDINGLIRNWIDTTGCSGLSDEESYSHPEESARLWSGIWRTLIQATPAENLVHFMYTGIAALGTVIGMPGLEKEIYKLLGQASCFVTRDVAQKIESALKANPYARERINIPELKALVLREEARLGWSKNGENESLKTLRSNLTPELKEAVDDKEEVIRASIEVVSRRGLFNNLLDALNGRLKTRFVENIIRFLNSIVHVESKWEFDTSNLTQEHVGSIKRWLFRR